jgi:hypothetical protein
VFGDASWLSAGLPYQGDSVWTGAAIVVELRRSPHRTTGPPSQRRAAGVGGNDEVGCTRSSDQNATAGEFHRGGSDILHRHSLRRSGHSYGARA